MPGAALTCGLSGLGASALRPASARLTPAPRGGWVASQTPAPACQRGPGWAGQGQCPGLRPPC